MDNRAHTTPRTRAFAVTTSPTRDGVRMKLGIGGRPRQARGEFHTYAVAQLPTREAHLFLELLEAGARALGVHLALTRSALPALPALTHHAHTTR